MKVFHQSLSCIGFGFGFDFHSHTLSRFTFSDGCHFTCKHSLSQEMLSNENLSLSKYGADILLYTCSSYEKRYEHISTHISQRINIITLFPLICYRLMSRRKASSPLSLSLSRLYSMVNQSMNRQRSLILSNVII